jgi:hypothetical protein
MRAEPGAGPGGPRDHSLSALLEDAQRLLRVHDWEGALDLYQMATALEPGRIELEGFIDLLRSRLVRRYRERIGDPSRIARLRIPLDRITDVNLPADAGFLLSLVDGRTSIDELLSLSGMGPFEAVRIFAGLLDAGILEVGS